MAFACDLHVVRESLKLTVVSALFIHVSHTGYTRNCISNRPLKLEPFARTTQPVYQVIYKCDYGWLKLRCYLVVDSDNITLTRPWYSLARHVIRLLCFHTDSLIYCSHPLFDVPQGKASNIKNHHLKNKWTFVIRLWFTFTFNFELVVLSLTGFSSSLSLGLQIITIATNTDTNIRRKNDFTCI